MKMSRRARWAVPAGALAVTAGVIAGSLITVAQAAPGLASKTPAQLVAEVMHSTTPALTGTIVETTSLGLPQLPQQGSPASIASLLTGPHTIKIWYASPRQFRLSVPATLSEDDLIRDGGTAWLWDSAGNSVTKFTLPDRAEQDTPGPAVAPLTPQQAAQQAIAAVGKTTDVTVASNVSVAGQAAYELLLSPKDSRSLIGGVAIAVDGSNGVPLRVQVFARGATSPAIQIGYTSIDFVSPAASELSFTPPPGATVKNENLGSGQPDSGSLSSGSVTGSGWLAVLDLPAADLTGLGQDPDIKPGTVSSSDGLNNQANDVVSTLLGSATPVSGAWGSGRMLRTSLLTVLITDSGQAFIGAVRPSVVEAAAAAAAGR
jgi:outer membrane lipoprotein-sorting protein